MVLKSVQPFLKSVQAIFKCTQPILKGVQPALKSVQPLLIAINKKTTKLTKLVVISIVFFSAEAMSFHFHRIPACQNTFFKSEQTSCT
ncbi:hypothetical protein B0X71_15080 [Planococcus lenghuensis]|uniref:Uncharacterized protein n=1 Tax=Planococcus lenghuensis TaxID=2213202 RepID=A0A1Q2L1H1_9BACL|nr:hypothetical protein B0X71_15080 [Planococcus lenghuensis]